MRDSLTPYTGAWLAPITVLALGLFYSATEGVLMALGSALISADLRTSGLAVLTTATAVAQLVSSLVVGFAWTQFGLRVTLWVFCAGLLAAAGIAYLTLPSDQPLEAVL